MNGRNVNRRDLNGSDVTVGDLPRHRRRAVRDEEHHQQAKRNRHQEYPEYAYYHVTIHDRRQQLGWQGGSRRHSRLEDQSLVLLTDA